MTNLPNARLSLARSRMRKYDTYDPRRASNVRVRISPKNSASFSDITRRNIMRTTVKRNIPLHFVRSAEMIQNPVPSASMSIALQSVRNAHFSDADSFADQFQGAAIAGNLDTISNNKKQKIFYAVACLVFIFALSVSIQSFITNNQAKQKLGVLGTQTGTDEYGVSQGTASNPAESAVSEQTIAAYQVAPNLPRYVRIPALEVFARVKHSGLESSGAIDAPRNINDVNWYNESAKPGNEIGSSLLLGHVSGWTASGVFKHIDKLKSGDTIEIEKGSGEKLQYVVTYTESVPVSSLDMAKVLASDEPGVHDLKLMTCSGKYNHEKDEYEERFIVHAKIVR
ncbi:MAG TPA: class F sortase [Candidatus Saccharibacteria bacterium]|jgi:LPXTG-site transpeptidase (sortase) family protein|nr:class F sortase [Candidatus Saccharibacteria bacterium]